jgi:NADH-quinone oxidoreductase subunit C
VSEETKSHTPPPGGEPKPPAGEPSAGTVQSAPSEKSATPEKAAATPEKSASEKSGSAEKSAPPAAKPAPPAKPAGPTPVPWESPLASRLKTRHGSGVIEASTYLGQNYLVLESSVTREVLQVLAEHEGFDYCVDITAVHYPKREKPFDLVWILYSFAKNERLRVKTMLADGEPFLSSVSIWPTANWLEREVYDMFGIKFDGHPDMKRILLPETWQGHPLRKEYGITQQDSQWVQINLGIESGQ